MVKLKLLLLLTYFGVISLASAQEITPLSQKDSADYLVTLATEKINGDPQLATALLRRAYVHSVKARYRAGEGKVLFLEARLLGGDNKNQEAIDTFLKAARLFETLKDSTRAGRAYTGVAGIYNFKFLNYTKAYQYCNKAIELLQNDSVYLANALGTLASLHLRTGKFDDALELYKKDLDGQRKRNNLKGMCISLNNIATAYDHKKDYKTSIAYYEKAMEISRAIGDDGNTAHILLGLGPIFCELKDHQKAKQALDESLALSEKHSLFDKQVYALQGLGMESEHLGKMDQAVTYSLRAKKIVEQKHLHFIKGSIYKQLSCIYKKANKPVLALEYEQKYSQFQDSLAHQEKLALANLKIDEKNTTPPAQNNDTSDFRGGWMIALSMIILVPGMFFIFYKKRKEKESWSDAGVSADVFPQPEQRSTDEEPEATHNNEADQKEGHPETSETTLQHLEVINGEGIKLLALNNIWWFQKEGKNYHAFTETGNYRVRQNITELEQALPRSRFFRINRAVIINTEQMSNYSFWENHKYIIRMKDTKKSEFVISRNRLREMKETFQVIEGTEK
ncbi:LytTR family transcriptional regulator [Fulvivirgaceae bacterium PWU4]|uniref:LytTR family transcriptional regulator n=1 Tax=Chryseosolibacter histidini TaxID=2782349 RepID=A0AAP2DQG2_9BACT|nr:tetratricopeptide repeat protein [Chryseosolibacter histidini]MBT1699463.1 LytTR family transcriptional regulator [Chryseosolibacter histidini]